MRRLRESRARLTTLATCLVAGWLAAACASTPAAHDAARPAPGASSSAADAGVRPSATVALAAADVPVPPPAFRLPTDVRPTSERISLRPDPRGTTYSGTVRIQLAVSAAAPAFWLHAQDLTVRREQARASLGPLMQKIDGGPFAIKQALDHIERCVAIHDRTDPAIDVWLSRRSKTGSALR